MTIILYNSTAEINTLNKSSYLTQVATLTGTLRDGCNIVDPQILVELQSLPTFNYVYIPELNRYYFVKSIDNYNNKLWVLYLHVDVLMTYKTQILNLKAEVDRNEFDYDLLLEDTNRQTESKYNVTITEASDSVPFYNIPTTTSELTSANSIVLYAMN